MTIIAGFKGHDGIVLCSDTQETIEHAKRKVSKLRIEPSDGKTEIVMACCGAGNNGPFIDKLMGIVWEDVQVATSLDEACTEAESGLKKTYKEYGQIYQRGYCPEVELIYGIKMHGDSRLFHACGPVVNEREYYAAGAGQYMADFISAKMFSGYMDVRQLVIIATYVLAQAKEHVDGCGGDSEIAVIRNQGQSGHVHFSFVDKMTELLSWCDKDLAHALMLCGDFGISRAKFKRALKDMISALAMSRDLKMKALCEEREMGRRLSFAGFVEVDDVGIEKPIKKGALKKMVKLTTSQISDGDT